MKLLAFCLFVLASSMVLSGPHASASTCSTFSALPTRITQAHVGNGVAWKGLDTSRKSVTLPPHRNSNVLRARFLALKALPSGRAVQSVQFRVTWEQAGGVITNGFLMQMHVAGNALPLYQFADLPTLKQVSAFDWTPTAPLTTGRLKSTGLGFDIGLLNYWGLVASRVTVYDIRALVTHCAP